MTKSGSVTALMMTLFEKYSPGRQNKKLYIIPLINKAFFRFKKKICKRSENNIIFYIDGTILFYLISTNIDIFRYIEIFKQK